MIKVDIENIEEIKNLVELLEKNFERLPKQLKDSLRDISKHGINDIDAKYVRERWGDDIKIETNFKTDSIISVNRILKKVVYEDDKGVKTEYPEQLLIKVNGELLVQW